MTNEEIHKLGEIQYLKGRLDELHKAIQTITNLEVGQFEIENYQSHPTIKAPLSN